MKRKHTQRHYLLLGLIERASMLPYSALFGAWVFMVLLFSQTYLFLSLFAPGNGIPAIREMGTIVEQIGNSIYFSIITATTVGFGDYVPVGIAKAVVALEAVLGFALFGIFVSKIVSGKQETALRNIHRLAFQNAFNNTREGFFILRHDCDEIIQEAETKRALSERSWDNLTVIFRKSQVLCEGILDFYDDFDWYDLDPRREALLIESVLRTSQRFRTMLAVFKKQGIDISVHAAAQSELLALTGFARQTMRAWEQAVSPENREQCRSAMQAMAEA